MNENGYSLSDLAAVTGGNRNEGMFGGDWSAWIILFLLFGLFGNGNGFGFGGGGFRNGGGQPATTADLTAQSIVGKLDGLTNGLSDSTYAITGAINGLSHQVSDCCCATQRAIDGVNYNMAKGFCDIGNAVNISTRDILESNNANTRAILDFLTQDKIATLTAENQNLKLAASQSNQNAVLMAAMDANKAEILRRTGAECPTAAYIVQPPQPVTFPTNCCGQFNGFGNGGCGNF
jgi:hypothetical protein